MINTFIQFYQKGLQDLRQEATQFKSEELLWKTLPGVKNSCGNLFLHLIGNLNYFIGAQMGNTGYVRNRDLEFSAKDVPVHEIIKQIEALETIIPTVLQSKSEGWLAEEFLMEFLGAKQKNEFMITQMLVHLNYHCGQINYLRRMLMN